MWRGAGTGAYMALPLLSSPLRSFLPTWLPLPQARSGSHTHIPRSTGVIFWTLSPKAALGSRSLAGVHQVGSRRNVHLEDPEE